MADVLVVDDDPAMRSILRTFLARCGHNVVEAEDGADAIARLGARSFDLVITDLVMPRVDGLEVVRHVRANHPRVPVIMLTAEGSISQCVSAMRAGASDFVTKPFHPPDLEEIVKNALPGPRPAKAGAPSATALDEPQVALIGKSEALREVVELVERIAGTSSTVLVTGESGTGKEVVARLLHGCSPRAGNPLVAVNCGAIPETLIESELFGHAKGAFTGATEAKTGRFVQANGGTLFLDEIGELPLSMQVKLLRVLQEREVTPVGDARARAVDVRVIAATNRDLEAMVREGKFRGDLYYRLEVLPIHLPALRERREDIPLLAEHFLASMNRRYAKDVVLQLDALAVMATYDWPGNVREMENLFERLVVLARDERIGAADLPARVRGASAAQAAAEVMTGQGGEGDSVDFQSAVEGFENALLERALRQASGNKKAAAESLGLSRTTFLDKLNRNKKT
ncbi:MAG TPA: sigma-54 dependent transcriptional regulator [Polyangia bacterium]|nr:sigma-54 dependent transcriptional regulator [Polyangia bacterium]